MTIHISKSYRNTFSSGTAWQAGFKTSGKGNTDKHELSSIVEVATIAKQGNFWKQFCGRKLWDWMWPVEGEGAEIKLVSRATLLLRSKWPKKENTLS